MLLMRSPTIHYLSVPFSPSTACQLLPAPLARWFQHRFGEPTLIQRLAWPAALQSQHLLISAPTGTGKSLAAFAPLLGALLETPLAPRGIDSSLRGLYLAPLKALVNDTARNLDTYLGEIKNYLSPQNAFLRLALRTGDTSPALRRKLLDEPPDILLSTPETLSLLLSLPCSSALFAQLQWVVVDEVHALVGNKRGADLAVSLERLESLTSSPPLRRIGLSATATPLDSAASWLVGPDRDCTVVTAPQAPAMHLHLEPLPEGARFLASLVDRLLQVLPQHRAVLVFTNTRSLAERLAWALRRRLPAWDNLIAVHHSAVAAARREEIEARFKRGELRAVVSSTSLELGIDIGSVDLAVLVHPPGDVIRLLQRIGRAGHEPGGIRQGLLLTANASELLEAAVTCASGRSGQCEPLLPLREPLDVLCQQILGACAARSLDIEEFYSLLRRSTPFANLSREDLQAALNYLRGLDLHGQSWLPARLIEDGDCWRIRDARTARLLRRNLGTILSERSVPVRIRVEDSLREIGSIDESFADRLQPGDRFLLDGRCLEYQAREEGAALVEEVLGRPRVPRWNSGDWPLSSQLAHRLYLLRVQAAEALREGKQKLETLLREDYALSGTAVEMLVDYFLEQESLSEVPDAGSLLIEEVRDGASTAYYLHTPLNRPANDALARVAVRRLWRDQALFATSEIADLGLVLRFRQQLPDPAPRIRQVLTFEGLAQELDESLATSEALRSRFAQVARTGLMVLRHPEGRQRRVGGIRWVERQLFEQVRGRDPNFLLLRQALRELREDLCEGQTAQAFVRDLPQRTIRCRALPRPSPFARAWTQHQSAELDPASNPAEALARLHAELTRKDHARTQGLDPDPTTSGPA